MIEWILYGLLVCFIYLIMRVMWLGKLINDNTKLRERIEAKQQKLKMERVMTLTGQNGSDKKKRKKSQKGLTTPIKKKKEKKTIEKKLDVYDEAFKAFKKRENLK